jgi:hypothetical protein
VRQVPRSALIIASERSGDGVRQLVRALGDDGYLTNWITTVEHDVVLGAVRDLCASVTDDGMLLLVFVGSANGSPGNWVLTFDPLGAGPSIVELSEAWSASPATKVVMLDCFAGNPNALASSFRGATVLAMSALPALDDTTRIATCCAFVADAISDASDRVTIEDVRASVARDAPAGTRVELEQVDPAHPVELVGPPPPSDVLDDDVRFTVYRPRAVAPSVWSTMIAFAHKTDAYDDPVRGRVDPVADVEAIAKRALDGAEEKYDHTGDDARTSLVRGSKLRFVPYVEGVRFNPSSVEFEWLEPVHYENFRLLASPELAGTRARGSLSVFLGATLVGDVSLTINIDADAAAQLDAQTPDVPEGARSYRKILLRTRTPTSTS